MPTEFDDFLSLLDDTPFEEIPVDVVTFVEGKEYLGLPPLSEIQYTIVESMAQIYRLEDLNRYMDSAIAYDFYHKYTKKEVILKLGKGSGKDHVSTIGCAYIVHKLLCLKNPAGYFGKPDDDAIDIINVAINAQQAKNVFFKGFKTKIKNSPLFRGRYDPKTDYINFDKNITVYSGHSERESHEGLNIILAILDEISGFAIDNPSGLEKAKTADAIYNAFRGTVDSRFSMGKVVLLSFPRHNNCFISQRYADAIAERFTVKRSHKFVLDESRDGDDSDNYFELEWDEDHITAYRYPGLYALCRPTWEVNPTKTIDDFIIPFVTNENDARGRFLAQPVMAADALFGRKDKIDSTLVLVNPLDTDMRPMQYLQPKPNVKYYMHADLAQKVDRCAVALSHVDKWVQIEYANGYKSMRPYIITDAIAYWKPQKGQPLDLTIAKDWIILMRSLGFDIDLITFDRWGCLPEHALVYTVDGPVQIKDVVPGQMVNTPVGPKQISSKQYTGNQEVFRIKTKLGHELEATSTHRVLTGSGWKTVGELTVDDELLLSNNLVDSDTDVITEEMAYVFGALVADGWYGHKKDQVISFTSADDDFANKVINGLINGFGFNNSVSIESRQNNKAKGYRFNDVKMIQRMRYLGLDRVSGKDKRIPWSVLQSSKKVVASFLAGYIDGDGGIQHYSDKTGTMRHRLTVDSASDKLLDQILWAFWYVGAEPVRLRGERNTSKGPTKTNRLALEGRKGYRALQLIHPTLDRKSYIESFDGRTERYIYSSGTMKLPIRSIESIGHHDTYDISVPDGEQFIAGGFVVHNSVDMQRDLSQLNFKCETLSVAKKHYEDMMVIMYEDRMKAPFIDILQDELYNLRVVRDKVDHPYKSGKDLSDALCGSVFNAATRSPMESDIVVEIHDFKTEISDKWRPNEHVVEISSYDELDIEVHVI